jgi:hypothetical protein
MHKKLPFVARAQHHLALPPFLSKEFASKILGMQVSIEDS